MNNHSKLDCYSIIKISGYLKFAEMIDFITANKDLYEVGKALLFKKEIIVRDMDLTEKQCEKLIFANKSWLEKIKLSILHNQDKLISAMVSCKYLTEIIAVSCGLTSEQLLMIGHKMKQVKVLDISANSDIIKEAIIVATTLPKLRKLLMYDVPSVDDSVLEECVDLEEIDIGKTRISELALLKYVCWARELKVIKIEDLYLSVELMDGMIYLLERQRKSVTVVTDYNSRTSLSSPDELDYVTVEYIEEEE